MKTPKPDIKSLTDHQIIDSYKKLYTTHQKKPTLGSLHNTLKETFGVSTSRTRLVAITNAIESAAVAPVNTLSDELGSSLAISILKFTNHAVEVQTNALKESLQSIQEELIDSAKQFDEQKKKNDALKDELANEQSNSAELARTLEVRDKQISSLQAQLEAKEVTAANVFAQQIEQKIEENFKLQTEIETLKQRFIAELTGLVGASKANSFTKGAAETQTSTLS